MQWVKRKAMMIALANDHAGVDFKQNIIAVFEELKLSWKDLGTSSKERTDYPLWAYRAAKLVASGECDRGILICGTGIGMMLSANKVQGIRCAVCGDCFSAQMSRAHNNANMLALGARVTGPDLAKMITQVWLETPFEGERHQRRVDLIMSIEQGAEL
jgi:ribose 5-phosphate isomerase B